MFFGKRAILRLYEDCDEEITVKKMKEIAERLKDKKGDRLELLKLMVIGFSQGVDNIQAYLDCDQSLTCLVGLLLGSDVEIVLWTTWCLTNMAAGTAKQASAVVKHASPYLITMLSVQNSLLQDQCAWAIGNLASAGDPVRKDLISRGALQPLAALLRGTSRDVVRSSAFALSNVVRSDVVKKNPKAVETIVVDMMKMLDDDDNNEDDVLLSECLWCLFFLSFRHLPVICRAGEDRSRLVEVLVRRLVRGARSSSSNLNVQLLTPLIRILGNFVCELPRVDFHHLLSGPETFAALDEILRSGIPHLQKETLWLLSNMTAHCQLASELANHGISETIESLVGPSRAETTSNGLDHEEMDFESFSIT